MHFLQEEREMYIDKSQVFHIANRYHLFKILVDFATFTSNWLMCYVEKWARIPYI